MTRDRISMVSVAVAVTLLCLGRSGQSAEPTLIRDVLVFDGEQPLGPMDVRIADGQIVQLGRSLASQSGETEVDGAGHTLLPGLIDCHVHVFAEQQLIQSAFFGVTTALDMMTQQAMAARFRGEQRAGNADHRADLFSAGGAVTVEGGHGTQFGIEVPTLDSESNAYAFVRQRVREGSDYIKIIYDDGAAYGIRFNTLTPEMLKASIAAAHEFDKLAVAHIGSREGAREVIASGVDGLVHLFADAVIDGELIELMKQQEVFVVPTCAVLQGIGGKSSVTALINDPALDGQWTAADLLALRQSYPRRSGSRADYDNVESTIQELHAAGIPILAGTDATNPGTAHGASMHHELELLVAAGLTPAEALAAGTSLPADKFGLDDRGKIAVGKRADLFLVAGDPTKDIKDTRQIVAVWKSGNRIDRRERVARIAKARENSETLKTAKVRPISDFEGPSIGSDFGAGWMQSTDQLFGGSSTVTLELVPGGAGDSSQALKIAGDVRQEQPAFAGAMFSPAPLPNQPADLSRHGQLEFWAKGPPREFRVMMFSQKSGFRPAVQTFKTEPQWTRQRMRISDFDGFDGTDIMGIFIGSDSAGEFECLIDNVKLIRE